MSGALLNITSTHTITTSATTISWDNATEVDDTYWSGGAATRITIPTGVTVVELFFYGSSATAGNTSTDYSFRILKNGTKIFGHIIDNGLYASKGLTTGRIAVVATDYFEIEVIAFGTGGITLSTQDTHFSVHTLERYGFVAAQLDSNTALSGSESILSWATPTSDTESTHDGTTGFVVPFGAAYAVLSYSGALVSNDVANGFVRVKVNGLEARFFCDAESLRNPGPGTFGTIGVTVGDTITITVTGADTLSAALTHLSIEWI